MGHEISVDAAHLIEAISITVPKARGQKQRSTRYPITIRFDEWGSMLRVTEARYGMKGHEAPAKGSWPAQVQIDGRKLRMLVEKLNTDAAVTLTATAGALVLSSGSFRIALERIDANGSGIEQTNCPKNKKHKGPVEVPRDPVGKRVELDSSWGFSARMPVPQHRKPRP